MLEFQTNEFHLNPKPNAVIFTEGEEWRALKRLYEFYGYSPDLLGIELRSLRGEGNFSLANWQCFIEYMHKKQTLVYFAVDREGRTSTEARKLFKSKRRFQFDGLVKVLPRKDRIKVWAHSFEESNFTSKEIAKAISLQGIQITTSDVIIARNQKSNRGLIERLKANMGFQVNKPQLDLDLATGLIKRREENPNCKTLTPVERFVQRSGNLIVLNHQPVDPAIRKENIKTGLLG